ncbi:MAG: hypothetical protein A3F41_02000 [Coxiella sp. RIFCSPHIGHO2_12_FULL_44_14]|nr:MAG: hypothetical protein A3F41_02000 [Coxiella sp. RIFCSPHIGHO2_12_FULL_44_14]
MDDKRILIVITALNVGGAEQHLLRILPELRQRGFNICVYVTNHPGTMAQEMENRGVHVIAPFGHTWFTQRGRVFIYAVSLLTLIGWILRYKPSVLHFFLPGSYLLGGIAGWFMRCPCMIMSRRITHEYQKNHFIIARFEKWLHKKMQFILANSLQIKKELQAEGVPESKLKIIYNGVDLNYYSTPIDRFQKRHALNLTPHTLVIMIIANLFTRKGHKDLLQALAQIKQNLPHPWVLLCIGRDGGEQRALENLREQWALTEHVHFLGERRDIAELQAIADVGVLSSHEEGFSNALIECMAAGLPMIVTHVGGNAEAILHRVCGIVVPPKEPSALAEAILTLAQDPDLRRCYARAAQERVGYHFSHVTCVNQYEALYKSLLAPQITP